MHTPLPSVSIDDFELVSFYWDDIGEKICIVPRQTMKIPDQKFPVMGLTIEPDIVCQCQFASPQKTLRQVNRSSSSVFNVACKQVFIQNFRLQRELNLQVQQKLLAKMILHNKCCHAVDNYQPICLPLIMSFVASFVSHSL